MTLKDLLQKLDKDTYVEIRRDTSKGEATTIFIGKCGKISADTTGYFAGKCVKSYGLRTLHYGTEEMQVISYVLYA